MGIQVKCNLLGESTINTMILFFLGIGMITLHIMKLLVIYR